MTLKYQNYPAAMTYDVPFLRHVTSYKRCDFCMFSKFVNFIPMCDLKIGTRIDWTYYVPRKKMQRSK